MKKLLFLLLFGFSSIYAIDERVIDFYFGNGVWNTREQAYDSTDKLQSFIANNIEIDAPHGIDLVYNWEEGHLNDVVETIYQLQQNGQLDVGFFVAVTTIFQITPLSLKDDLLSAIADSLELARNTQPENLKEMVERYKSSINEGHYVILVSHSQGNLFGVQAYDKLDSWQKKYFQQVSVATPANRVAGGWEHVTVENDSIINYIVNAAASVLPANAINTNTALFSSSGHHGFVDEYLGGDVTHGIIINMIRSSINSASNSHSQWLMSESASCSIKGCENKMRNVTHRYDKSLDEKMGDTKVYPFDDDGKLYPVTNGYVKADYIHGYSVETMEDNNPLKFCYVLKDEADNWHGHIKKDEPCPKCESIKSTLGFVEVGVNWGSSKTIIDLKVDFPNGNYDFNMPACKFEHFYSTSDNGVSEGLYPVIVNYEELYDMHITERLSNDILIKIKVPGHEESRATNYYQLDYLKGHVADIRVYSNASYNSTFFCSNCSLGGYGGGGWGGSSGGGGWGGSSRGGGSGGGAKGGIYYTPANATEMIEYLYDIIWYISKGILGPLSGADVNIYEIKDYDFTANSGSNPLFTSKTTEGGTLLSAGNIPTPQGLDDEKLYVVEIKGGLDIDADDDANVDDTPTENHGVLRLVMSGYEINNLGFKVNVLTEIIYQLAKGSIDENNQSVFIEKSDDAARCLLKTDMNIDGTIDTIDAIAWMPFYGKDELLNHNYSLYYEPIIDKIHKNQNIYNEALNIYKNPIFLDDTVYFLSNTTVGSAIGKVPYVCGDGFTIYEALGANALYFDIDGGGQIIASKIPDDTGSYPLNVNMKNSNMDSVNGTINIQMIHEHAPFLTKNRFNNAIPDIIEDGFDLGKAVIVDEGLSPLSDIHLEGEGADNFEIDKNGHIYISQRSHIDLKDAAYRLKVVASNQYGTGIPVEIIIYVYAEYELVPMLMDTSVGMYGTEIAAGKVIGKMKAAENIFCPISGFQTNSTLFGVKPNGDIYIKAYPSSNEYNVKVYAQSRCGNSNTANLKIDRLNRLIGELGVSNAKRLTLSFDNTKMFVASGKDGIKIMNITNPIIPELIGAISTHNALDTVLSSDNTKVYVADGEGGVKIFDLSNLQNPALIKTISGVNAQKISLSRDGSKIYATDKTEGLKIINVSNPSSAYIAGDIGSYVFYDAVQHSNNDNILLTAGGFGGLKIYDITDLSNPVLIGAAETAYAQNIAVFNNTAYIADGSGGVKIADVINASLPNVTAAISLSNAYNIAVSSDNTIVYAAGGESGLFVVDIKSAFVINSINIIDARFVVVLKDMSKAYVVNNKGNIFVVAL